MKAPTTALCGFVDQLDTTQMVYLERGYISKVSVEQQHQKY